MRTETVITAHRNQTQNQGISRDIVVYSEIGQMSQVINNTEPNVRQENGRTKLGR